MKLEINNKRKTVKFRILWKLNNTFLNNQWIEEDITREIIKYLETNANENPTCQNFRDAVNVVLRGKFIANCLYIKKTRF